MYKVVKTKKQQKDFEQTWEYFCCKYRWYNDPYAIDGIRYNLMDKKKIIGTVEFIPYFPHSNSSTVEGKSCDFSMFHKFAEINGKVWEVDKLCLKEEYQRKGYFELFIKVLSHHVTKHQPLYYLAYIESKFYRMLKIEYGIQIEVLGKPLIEHNTKLLPVSITAYDLNNVLEDMRIVKYNNFFQILKSLYTSILNKIRPLFSFTQKICRK